MKTFTLEEAEHITCPQTISCAEAARGCIGPDRCPLCWFDEWKLHPDFYSSKFKTMDEAVETLGEPVAHYRCGLGG